MARSQSKTEENRGRPPLDADPFTSCSLNEEVILHRLFAANHSGFYVDVGAGQPRLKNDTFLLHQRGWRGINIEPNYAFHAALTEERPTDINLRTDLSVCPRDAFVLPELSDSGLSFCEMKEPTASQGFGSPLREVPVTTLAKILTEVGMDHIHLLKVDLGGFEEEVLDGNDWEKFRPDVVVVKVHSVENPPLHHTSVRDCMDRRGYRHLYFDGVNDFYLEREYDVPENWSHPQSVFDYPAPQVVSERKQESQTVELDTLATEESGLSVETQLESLQSQFAAAEEYALALQNRVESLKTASTITDEYALTLETEVESLRIISTTAEKQAELLRHTGEALATENRRLGHQATQLTSENRRLRNGAEQMRWELLALNRLLEQHYAIAGPIERQRRSGEPELDAFNYERLTDPRQLENKVATLSGELMAAKARLASVCSSRCWRLTAPLRWCDNLLRLALNRLWKAN